MNRYNQWVLLVTVPACIGLCPVAGAFAAEDSDACAMLHKADVEAAFPHASLIRASLASR